jgi:preprotein translocase subunit SecG
MTVTSLIGLGAAIGGLLMLVAESEAGLAVVMASMVVLWLIATIHHSLLAKTARPTAVDKTL